MKFVFVFQRLNCNKIQAPLIAEALGRGDEVEIWLNQRDISKTTKWYEFPDEKKFPKFHPEKNPIYRIFRDEPEFAELGRTTDAKILFTMMPLYFPKPANQIWVNVAPGFMESICSWPQEELNKIDLFFLSTPYWIEQAIRYLEINGLLERGSALEQHYRKTWLATGTSWFDHGYYCDRSRIRKNLGIAEDARVVLVFAFEAMTSFWCNKIFLEERLWKRLFNVLFLPFTYPGMISKIGKKKFFRMLAKSIWQRPEFLWEALTSASELDVLRAIREFCDKNGCTMVLKARRKCDLKPYHHELPDVVVREDLDYFPSTAAQVESISDFCVTFYTTGCPETAAGGVPVLNLVPAKQKYYIRDQIELIILHGAKAMEIGNEETIYNTRPGGLFEFSGLVRSWTVNDLVKRLPGCLFEEFKADPVAHRDYIHKFIREVDSISAPRILDELTKRFG